MNALNYEQLNAHKRQEEKKTKETEAYGEIKSKINFSVFIIFMYFILFLFLFVICLF